MTSVSLQLDYASTDELTTRDASWWNGVLGIAGFDHPPAVLSCDAPVTASMTPQLGGGVPRCEVWRAAGDRAVSMVSSPAGGGRLRYRHCNGLLFGSITVEAPIPSLGASVPLSNATRHAYQAIFAALDETAHPHLVRVWNYLPNINDYANGDERYRWFNAARRCAFRESGRGADATLPAASALGSPAGSPLSIYFLAARRPPCMVENPRQTSAYHYPPQFGTAAPSFSRACVLDGAARHILFISGTASIVGHETRHAGDARAQTRETVANITSLVAEANRTATAGFSLNSLKYKVYVRSASDLPEISSTLSAMLKPSAPIVYLRADICRKDLLVEIEAAGVSDDR